MAQSPAVDESLIRRLFAEIFELNVEAVTLELSPEIVEAWDSFGHMRLITAVESTFGVRLSMEQVVAIDSYASLCAIVTEASRNK